MSGVVALEEADDACGSKAATLGRLCRAGVAVPDGVVVRAPRDEGWQAPLLARLGGGPYAVRSSGRFEDGPEASFAGQLLTLLDVERDEVVSAVLAVERSTRRGAVRGYAAGRGLSSPTTCPVLVQDLVRPRAAGVLFSRHPTVADGPSVIECVRGSGESVVDGTATPERWVIDGKPHRVLRAADGPNVLTVVEVHRVVDAAAQVVAVLGPGQDIEWALAGDDVAVLQSRPITATGTPDALPRPRSAPGGLSGTGASPGVARGPARLVASLDDLTRVAAGDILVCRTTSPAWTPAMLRSAAVVTEVGGVLSHAAIVAREFGVPAVVAVPDAMSRLIEGSTVQVDGSSGVVTPLATTGETA